MLKVAIQGIKGSFHDEAAQKLVPDAETVECTTFQDVFDAVISGVADYGVAAIENSLHGSINPVYRLLDRNELWVAGEVTLHIQQFLIGPADISVEKLNVPEAEVRSMFPAFAQAELWLNENLPNPQRVELYDTAYAVRTVVEEGDPLHVAIGGKHAADLYGGHIINGSINDDPHNYTRFVLLSKDKVYVDNANRTSIILTTGHTEGALFEALRVFADRNINLSKLDSHPIPSDKRHYAFYIDLEAPLEQGGVQEAFAELEKTGCTVKVLGSYRTAL